MATEVSVRSISSGDIDFYSTYADARNNADPGDVISIYANLEEEIILKDLVDVYILPGTIVSTTITDNEDPCRCNITGRGIIKNLDGECINITSEDSVINIECHSIKGQGSIVDSTKGASVYVTAAKRFSLICDTVLNKYNTPVFIENCNDYFLKIRNVESGVPDNPNTGAPAMYFDGSGSIYINELECTGYGSCLSHAGGNLAATIKKIVTLPPSDETPATIAPTLLVDGGTGNQELVLYFEEIKNLNSQNGDVVRIAEGKATLIGKNIFSANGLSLDLTGNVISALVQCDSIISLTKGINIANSDEQVIIQANYIEGSDGNDGVVRSASGSNYALRNAKIVNTSTGSDSVCIFIALGATPTNQSIEVENLILITGNISNGDTIRRAGSTEINIKNLGLFVNKALDEDMINLEIGLGLGDPEYNYKYIVSTDIF